jgi:hypothetical protein
VRLWNRAAKRKPAEESAEQQSAAELVRPGKEQGLSLTGPDTLLIQVIHDLGDQSEPFPSC